MPAGVLMNEVARDFANQSRATNNLPGAYRGSSEPLQALYSTYLRGIVN